MIDVKKYDFVIFMDKLASKRITINNPNFIELNVNRLFGDIIETNGLSQLEKVRGKKLVIVDDLQDHIDAFIAVRRAIEGFCPASVDLMACNRIKLMSPLLKEYFSNINNI